MVISDFTGFELNFLRRSCNFVGCERDVFELRSQGISLEEIAEILNMSVDGVKKISRKVNGKILRVMAKGGKADDERRGYCILEESL